MEKPTEPIGLQSSIATDSSAMRKVNLCRATEADQILPELTVGGNAVEIALCIP